MSPTAAQFESGIEMFYVRVHEQTEVVRHLRRRDPKRAVSSYGSEGAPVPVMCKQTVTALSHLAVVTQDREATCWRLIEGTYSGDGMGRICLACALAYITATTTGEGDEAAERIRELVDEHEQQVAARKAEERAARRAAAATSTTTSTTAAAGAAGGGKAVVVKPLAEGIPSTREEAAPGDVWAWRQGRRVYVACPKDSSLADQLKAAGLKWDPAAWARWCGSTRADAIAAVVLAALPEREAERAAQAAAKTAEQERRARQQAAEAAQREQSLAAMAKARPIFRKIDGAWWLVGAGLERGQRVEVATRHGETRVVVVTMVTEHDPAAGLVKAQVRDWTRRDEQDAAAKAAGHDVVVDFQADTWGTPKPRITVGGVEFVQMSRREGTPWRMVIKAETTRWKDHDDEWGDRTRWVLADPTPEQAAALDAHFAAEAAHDAAVARAKSIHARIRSNHVPFTADEPASFTLPEPKWCGERSLYGVGSWFAIDEEGGYIWAVENNGMDGDDWSRNNVVTGGAGAIGYRIAYDPALAAEIRDLHERGAWLYRNSII